MIEKPLKKNPYEQYDKPYEFWSFKDHGTISYPAFYTHGGFRTQWERIGLAELKAKEMTF